MSFLGDGKAGKGCKVGERRIEAVGVGCGVWDTEDAGYDIGKVGVGGKGEELLLACANGVVGEFVMDVRGEVGAAKGWMLLAGAMRKRVRRIISRSGGVEEVSKYRQCGEIMPDKIGKWLKMEWRCNRRSMP